MIMATIINYYYSGK